MRRLTTPGFIAVCLIALAACAPQSCPVSRCRYADDRCPAWAAECPAHCRGCRHCARGDGETSPALPAPSGDTAGNPQHGCFGRFGDGCSSKK